MYVIIGWLDCFYLGVILNGFVFIIKMTLVIIRIVIYDQLLLRFTMKSIARENMLYPTDLYVYFFFRQLYHKYVH